MKKVLLALAITAMTSVGFAGNETANRFPAQEAVAEDQALAAIDDMAGDPLIDEELAKKSLGSEAEVLKGFIRDVRSYCDGSLPTDGSLPSCVGAYERAHEKLYSYFFIGKYALVDQPGVQVVKRFNNWANYRTVLSYLAKYDTKYIHMIRNYTADKGFDSKGLRLVKKEQKSEEKDKAKNSNRRKQ